MSEEVAKELIKSRPADDATTLSPTEARKLREAHLVKRGGLSGDEVRDELEAEFGALD
jgi:hypothetical protein